MRTVAFVETDFFCQKILKKHWPDVPIYGDIREINGLEIQRKHGPIGIITGGFPCQPFSVAGKREGKGDDRYLWPEMLRVIREIHPPWVLGENVAGIANMVLDEVLFDLESEGYEAQSFIIPACAVNAPHRRDRVWIIAHNARNACGGRLERKSWRGAEKKPENGFMESKSSPTSDTNHERLQGHGEYEECSGEFPVGAETWQEAWFEVATRLCRVDDGVSSGMDRAKRLKALGNAVVPQVVEVIGRMIMRVEIESNRGDEVIG
jgi:DNA (cytosine-5)-methyltransferase 1